MLSLDGTEQLSACCDVNPPLITPPIRSATIRQGGFDVLIFLQDENRVIIHLHSEQKLFHITKKKQKLRKQDQSRERSPHPACTVSHIKHVATMKPLHCVWDHSIAAMNHKELI